MAKRDLKSFANQKTPQKASSKQQAQAEQILKQAEQFQGKSDAQLMAQLKAEINRGKKDGSFNQETMRNFMEQVAPMMNAEQRKKLEAIAKKLM